MLRPVVHSFGHASSSLSPPLTLSPSLFRGSRAAAPKLPEIIGFFCFPVIRCMARSPAPPFHVISTCPRDALRFHIYSFVAFPLSFRSFPLSPSPFPSDNAPATSTAMSFLLLVFLQGEFSSSSISFVTRCAYFPAFVSRRFSPQNTVINPDIGTKWRG